MSEGKKDLSAERVLGVIPGLCSTMAREEAVELLAGKGKMPDQQAVIALIRWMREDAVRAAVQPNWSEREAGFYSGEVNALHQLEEWLLSIYGKGAGDE